LYIYICLYAYVACWCSSILGANYSYRSRPKGNRLPKCFTAALRILVTYIDGRSVGSGGHSAVPSTLSGDTCHPPPPSLRTNCPNVVGHLPIRVAPKTTYHTFRKKKYHVCKRDLSCVSKMALTYSDINILTFCCNEKKLGRFPHDTAFPSGKRET